MTRGRCRCRRPLSIAEERNHLVADDPNDLLRRRGCGEHPAHRTVANPVDKRLDDLEIDVRFEQRETNLRARLDVLFGGVAPRPKVLKTSWRRIERVDDPNLL
jgi:hypothetical protein